jgi:DNA ligase (NAD+)
MITLIGKFFAAALGKQAGGGRISHPTQTCPECGSRLLTPAPDGLAGLPPHRAGAWRCPNPDCPAQVRASLEHWCSADAMDIAGTDAVLVAKLVAHGLPRDVSELYRLKLKEIAALPGMDQSSAQTVFDALTASLKRDAWRLLFGLGIPGVGAAEARSLCRHFGSVDNVFAAGGPRLMQAEGIGAETARSLARWHSDPENRRLLKRLFKLGLNFKA